MVEGDKVEGGKKGGVGGEEKSEVRVLGKREEGGRQRGKWGRG